MEKIWNHVWMTLGVIAATTVIVILTILIVAEKKTLRYSLESDSYGNQVYILKEIDWATDKKIYPSRFLTDSQLVVMVDSLNSQLRRHEKERK